VSEAVSILEGVELAGVVNTPDNQLLANIRASIRRGHPQIKPQPIQADAVALVCGGPSINDTVDEIRDAVAAGAKIVTVNGAYQWCVERNLIPSMQIVMDARATNARFLEPALPRCHYALASQCHPALWDAVEGRSNVWIYHVGASDEQSEAKTLLDAYYMKQWHGIGGGTTVGTRAIALLRTLGYVRFDVFGMDCCWLDGAHHAYAQPENANDKRIATTIHPVGEPELARTFWCAPWQMKQLDDLMLMLRYHGHQFVLNLHGDGMAAYALRASAGVVVAANAAQSA
jgi:hypothetical protein